MKIARQQGSKTLTEQLKRWSPPTGPERVRLLVGLWRESWGLWETNLAYRTIQAVEEAAARFAGDTAVPRAGEADWEDNALRAVSRAIGLITADTDVFKQMNLSSAEGLKSAAESAVATADDIRQALVSLGPPPSQVADACPPLAADLGEIEGTTGERHDYYVAIVCAAKTLIEFRGWLATAPRLAPSRPAVSSSRSTCRSGIATPSRSKQLNRPVVAWMSCARSSSTRRSGPWALKSANPGHPVTP